jgi:hypothetical protein
MPKNQRDALLACGLKRVRVKLPEYDLDLYVQEMTAAQRDEYYAVLTNALTNKEQKANLAAKILLPSLLDLEGFPLFDDDDLDNLAKVSPQVITKLTNSLLQVSGLLPDFYEAEKKRLSKARISSTGSRASWGALFRK